jgi:hypothetical protein
MRAAGSIPWVHGQHRRQAIRLKRSTGEGRSDQQLAEVAAWEAVIVGVTKQEMLHLALATTSST